MRIQRRAVSDARICRSQLCTKALEYILDFVDTCMPHTAALDIHQDSAYRALLYVIYIHSYSREVMQLLHDLCTCAQRRARTLQLATTASCCEACIDACMCTHS
jgi:hypothetical protein